ncbi:MAG TPA: hypothetical protein VI300_18145 [Solirubrobacter sp.]
MATSRLIDSVREAPAAALGVRPTTTWREDLNAMVLAIWPITARLEGSFGVNAFEKAVKSGL